MSTTSSSSNTSIEKPEEEKKKSPWLDAHYNPVASLNTLTSCIDLADLHGDGEYKLVIANLGVRYQKMKLKVFKGTSVMSESTILDLPTAVVTFHMDQSEPKTPAIAVASGPCIFIYKNLKPYYKFALPLCEVNPIENDIWNQAKEDSINVEALYEMLSSLRDELGPSVLTVRSLKMLQLPPEEVEDFASLHKHSPLKKQSIVTCMSTLKKSSNDEGSISCLVIGSENKEIFILDTEAFTVLSKNSLQSVPVFLNVSGLFDVDYRIMIACRDAKVYHVKKGNEPPRLAFELQSPVCGLERVGKNIVVGCMDQTVTCFTTKGKKLWAIHLPALITTMAVLNHKARGYKALMIALNNAEVRIYRDTVLANTIQVPDVINGIRFGRFGREDGALVMTTKGGGLMVKILKRTANFTGVDGEATGAPSTQLVKLTIPKKTKLFVDQALRERESGIDMHQVFQSDLFRLRLITARAFAKTLKNSSNPISSKVDDPLKLSAQVQGIGPSFKIIMTVQNTSSNIPSTDLLITLHTNFNIYKISKPIIQVPILIPGISYIYETMVDCMSENGIADQVKVFLLHTGNPVPIITAVISMPVSEATVVV